MLLRKSMLLGAVCVVAMSFAIAAQAQYYPAPPPVYYQPPPTPPSWSYDPYTSRSSPCPQGVPGDLTMCQQRPPATVQQPAYWPPR
jgi:hypothetical protein